MIAVMRKAHRGFRKGCGYKVVGFGQVTYKGKHLVSVTLTRGKPDNPTMVSMPQMFVTLFADKESAYAKQDSSDR
jgi:hypothetical protein